LTKFETPPERKWQIKEARRSSLNKDGIKEENFPLIAVQSLVD